MKKYKDYLLFIAKCLTLDSDAERVVEVRETIQRGNINWEKVVMVSSGQLLMPAMYLQLKRNALLPLLPEDLVESLDEITTLNRERNIAILQQAKDVTERLNKHHIYPVFLKGVAHLLSGLYTDIAERMIGDIDFLLPENEVVKAAEIFIELGFTPVIEFQSETLEKSKHYPRLQNENYPAALEIHKEVVKYSQRKTFRAIELLQDKQAVEQWEAKAFIPSTKHQIIHNVYNSQLNDGGFFIGEIVLRPMYDLCLLAVKNDINEVTMQHGKRLRVFNAYFNAINYVFTNPKSFSHVNTQSNVFFILRLKLFLNYPGLINFSQKVDFIYERISRYIKAPIRSIYDKEERKLLYFKLSDPKWYVAHIQFYADHFKTK